MKKLFALAMTAALALVMLAACGSDASSASSEPAVSSSASQPASASAPASTPASGDDPVDGSGLQAKLETIAAAAGLGADPLDLTAYIDLDLRAGEVDTANIEAVAGYESKTSAENGGIVIVIQAKPGTAGTVKADLEKFKQSRMGNPDYAEFENARNNTENARIVSSGDYVVYAVSAEGDAGWDKLDAAIEAALA